MTNSNHHVMRLALFAGAVSWVVACGDSKSELAEDHGTVAYTLHTEDAALQVMPGSQSPMMAGSVDDTLSLPMVTQGVRAGHADRGLLFPALQAVPYDRELGAADRDLGVNLLGSNWTNLGGNAQNNGRSTATGPNVASLLWYGGRPSVIGWHPFIEGNRVFVVRQSILQAGPGDSVIVAYDLSTGRELWAAEIPYKAGQHTTWIAGVSNGRVYAARSEASRLSPFYALSAQTGALLWTSPETTAAGAYDGVVFADNGDLLVGDFRTLKRIRATDGTTAWITPRRCSVSGSCGGARLANAVYLAEFVNDGHVIARFDATTGRRVYDSSVMPDPSGIHTVQNTPFVGPDGSVYLSRTKNNDAADYFFAFSDTGSALVERWRIPTGWTTHTHYAVGPDASVYAMNKAREIVRLDPATGAVRNTSKPITDMNAYSVGPQMAVDAQGRLFVNNRSAHEQPAEDDGTVYSFNADLTLRWSVPASRINQGGPAIAPDGTMILAGRNNDLRAYR